MRSPVTAAGHQSHSAENLSAIAKFYTGGCEDDSRFRRTFTRFERKTEGSGPVEAAARSLGSRNPESSGQMQSRLMLSASPAVKRAVTWQTQDALGGSV